MPKNIKFMVALRFDDQTFIQKGSVFELPVDALKLKTDEFIARYLYPSILAVHKATAEALGLGDPNNQTDDTVQSDTLS